MVGNVTHEGLDTKEADWIVVDLNVALVHIFEPQARIEYAIDERLGEQTRALELTLENALLQLASATPRSHGRIRSTFKKY